MNVSEYKNLIKSRMGERRYIHSVNVAKAAVKLAKLYGADVNKAEIAGILHDSCKEIPKNEMLQIISSGGIILDVVENNSSKLWHAIAGSVYAETELGIKDKDIISAIRYHTTGRAGMSMLEKIIFTADFISDERNYPDVDIMRKKAFEDLDDAMLYALQFTLKNLSANKMPIHSDALDCYNDIIINSTKKELL